MESGLWTMRGSLMDALDQISSTRSSTETRAAAFETIERHLASALANKDENEGLDCFLALQYTFECNIPLRMLSWIAVATTQLDNLTKGTMDESNDLEASTLASQLTQALSLIQGMTLSHMACKDYLGRKYALEVLLDLLLTSRHMPSSTSDTDPNACRRLSLTSLPLTSIVLDTLLCILVDSSPALRAFEDANGPQAVVRILKRAGTPREVRMKCLEFLYFYLLDETTPTAPTEELELELTPAPVPALAPAFVPTAPATPIRPPKQYAGIGATPRRPATSTTYGSSTYAFSDAPSSRSTSGSSTLSFSSTSSNASSSTAATSTSSSPDRPSALRTSLTSRSRSRSPQKPSSRLSSSAEPSQDTPPPPPPSTLPAFRFPTPLQPRMMMLKKEVEYEPMSPKKGTSTSRSPSQTTPPSLGFLPRHPKSKSLSNVLSGPPPGRIKSRLGSAATVPDIGNSSSASYDASVAVAEKERAKRDEEGGGVKRKTTEEKKELLGTMLGNVDALVEGVRKAGIWGLG